MSIESVAGNGSTGKCAERGRADEFASAARHHDGYAVPVLDERAHEHGRLKRRDAAGNADEKFVCHD